MQFIDFHTHTKKTNTDSLSVCSLRVNEIDRIEGAGPFTIGIHPWDSTNSNLDFQLKKLKELVHHSRVLAVGEIGLDRLRGAPLDTQIELFKKQAEIAEDLKKPVVIHCVRSFSEIQQLRKQLKPQMHWAVHNFMGNPQIAKSLVQQGFYISFCIALAKSEKLCEALKSIPLDRVFFETDDFIENVSDVYVAASNCLSIPVEKLKVQIEKNYENFFNNH
ncbi:MAG TPA: TatD family hydrolase [Tenuifilaceae bacterium]|nr:TatD family hydrolase [Tenuifilaceae bacterium]HPJ45832.1 TatD family hydrolase [Tenuifilaceae bacterium]HPQ33548.1 TatD family hydrolase [Tenuifilaceae bacterium]